MEIEADLNKPYVKLDKENCILLFKGKSYPEHPSVFYEPILKELNNCIDYMDKKDVTINLALEIMNSVSTKYLYNIIKSISESSKQINIYKMQTPRWKFYLLTLMYGIFQIYLISLEIICSQN